MLHSIVQYADARLSSEPGFRTREVRWRIELSANGRFLGVVPLGDGKRGEDLPKCPDMHGMNAGGKSHLLIETTQTVALLFKPNESPATIERATERHTYFAELLREASQAVPSLGAVVRVLNDDAQFTRLRDALGAASAKPTDWMAWSVDGADPRDDALLQEWWRTWRRNDLSSRTHEIAGIRAKADPMMLCLITGGPVQPLATHPKIGGLSGVGGIGSGDVVVGFDKASYRSFGLEQSANAAMSAEAAQKYVDGLNDLVRNHSRRLGNSLVVHWYARQVPVEDDPLAFLYGLESAEQAEAAALGAARRLLDSIRTGERPDLGENRYFALTLSGASGRVMVRDWMEGRFEDLARNVISWFSDLAIVARDGSCLAPDPKFMAACGALVRDLDDLPAPTIGAVWKAAVLSLPIPRQLLAQALGRFRADLVDKDSPALNHARMSLIKAYFVRLCPGGDSTTNAYLNPEHPAAAYHCGRLLAILANLQRAALGDVGAGVVQRYYAAASQSPGLVLGRLATNARNHLAKLEGGLPFWYENQIADVMARLKDGAPRILDLEGQGLFALGYYQQLASLRAGNKSGNSESPDMTEKTK